MIEYGNGVHNNYQPFQYILIELANGGSLFDFVAKSGRLMEEYARYFFK